MRLNLKRPRLTNDDAGVSKFISAALQIDGAKQKADDVKLFSKRCAPTKAIALPKDCLRISSKIYRINLAAIPEIDYQTLLEFFSKNFYVTLFCLVKHRDYIFEKNIFVSDVFRFISSLK